MFVILTYDVQHKRAAQTLKLCRKYLHSVQRSVLEGTLTELQLEKLKKDLAQLIEPKHDAVCIYVLGSIKYAKRHEIGVSHTFDGIL